MKKLALIFVLLFMVSCSGGGGGGSDSGSSSGGKNLSNEPNLQNLYKKTSAELQKDEYETTNEYEARIAEYATTLTGYYSISILDTEYNADTKELMIRSLPISISNHILNYDETQIAFYDGYTKLEIENYDILPEVNYGDLVTVGNISFYKSCYKIIIVEPDEAERIADGFRVKYTYTFPIDILRDSKNSCASAYWTNCTNHLYGNVETFMVYNVIDGKEY